jgi:hypothetical protein
VLHATRFIAQGDEICDCYIELRQSTADRQRDLNAYYRFTCSCTACVGSLCVSSNSESNNNNGNCRDDGDGDGAINACVASGSIASICSTVKLAAADILELSAEQQQQQIKQQFQKEEKQQQQQTPQVFPCAPITPVSSDNISTNDDDDDARRVAAMALDRKMMQLAEEGQVQKALACSFEIIKVPTCCFCFFLPVIIARYT